MFELKQKQNIDNIKPFNYEESTELNLDQMMLNDSMKSDFNDLSLNTAIDSSVNEKETESDNQTITDSDIESGGAGKIHRNILKKDGFLLKLRKKI